MSRTAHDKVLRRRIETAVALAAPLLDLVLFACGRISRLLGAEQPDPLPAGVRRDGGPAARGRHRGLAHEQPPGRDPQHG